MGSATLTGTAALAIGSSNRLAHYGYIAAAQAEITGHGVHVRFRRIGDATLRHADLAIHTGELDHTTPMLLRWDELNGWSLHDRTTAETSCVCFGLLVLPEPADIAIWVLQSMRHLDITAGRVGAPLAPSDIAERLEHHNTRYGN